MRFAAGFFECRNFVVKSLPISSKDMRASDNNVDLLGSCIEGSANLADSFS